MGIVEIRRGDGTYICSQVNPSVFDSIIYSAIAIAAVMVSAFTACSNASTQNSKNDEWPTKAVNVVVTASAGGDTDFNARTFATYFEKVTGQPMVITNTLGGGGSVATLEVKDSKPDGNKILFCHTGQMIVNEVADLIDYNMDDFNIASIPAVDRGTIKRYKR